MDMSHKFTQFLFFLYSSGIGSFSKLGSPCIWIDNYHPSDAQFEKFSNIQSYHYYALWGAAILYLIGIGIFLFCSVLGMIGCWRRSTKTILTTALLMLFSG